MGSVVVFLFVFKMLVICVFFLISLARSLSLSLMFFSSKNQHFIFFLSASYFNDFCFLSFSSFYIGFDLLFSSFLRWELRWLIWNHFHCWTYSLIWHGFIEYLHKRYVILERCFGKCELSNEFLVFTRLVEFLKVKLFPLSINIRLCLITFVGF